MKTKLFELKMKFWGKVSKIAMKKAHPRWDFAYFYEYTYEWLKLASVEFEKYSKLERSEEVVKELKVASEIAEKICEGKYDVLQILTKEEPKELSNQPFDYTTWNKEENHHLFYLLGAFGYMLSNYSAGWWW